MAMFMMFPIEFLSFAYRLYENYTRRHHDTGVVVSKEEQPRRHATTNDDVKVGETIMRSLRSKNWINADI
jgi:hypothetical protein